MRFATVDSTASLVRRIHRLGRKLQIGLDAGGLRRPPTRETAGPSRRLAVLRLPAAAAVPEAFVLDVFARISGHGRDSSAGELTGHRLQVPGAGGPVTCNLSPTSHGS